MRAAIGISLGLLFLILGPVVACSQGGSVVKISEAANHTVIHAKVGQQISINLPAQFGTGYSWIPSAETKSQLILQKKDDTTAHRDEPLLPGGAESQTFQFVAVRTGIVLLRYDYVQPWNHDAKPAKDFVVRIVVEKS